MSADPSRRSMLAIYLEDHYAGSCAGVALVGRIAGRHAGTDIAPDLRWLAAQVAEDQRSLLVIMERLGMRPAKYKNVLAMAGERISRLKPNGRLFRGSPLSTVVELQSMQLGVTGKRCGWQDLRDLVDDVPALDAHHLDELTRRADEQITRLAALRHTAVVRALGNR
jgi:hypothetical protein